MPSAVALIPARSGSERVKDKNVRPLAGHPLLAYAVATARQSGIFDRVVCSTDSGKIGEVAQRYGADVPYLRPQELATSILNRNVSGTSGSRPPRIPVVSSLGSSYR